jgi:hypothetical protein
MSKVTSTVHDNVDDAYLNPVTCVLVAVDVVSDPLVQDLEEVVCPKRFDICLKRRTYLSSKNVNRFQQPYSLTDHNLSSIADLTLYGVIVGSPIQNVESKITGEFPVIYVWLNDHIYVF